MEEEITTPNAIALTIFALVWSYLNEIISGYKAIMERHNVIELENNRN